MSLPVAAEIHRRFVCKGQPGDPVDLLAVGQAPIVLPPCGLLREAEKVRAGNVVVMADFRAAHAAEIFLCPIGARAV